MAWAYDFSRNVGRFRLNLNINHRRYHYLIIRYLA